ncbi:ASCH domain-containing protein [Rossellomorea vietnamensis]|uniref:ASCH domain-containing protein n=2 Tax=Rossellomorea TaxID=2837508 RepID=A0A5D4KBL8_9BACI|nr:MULTISPECIES: ASCH domain-containing protein [Rossellomorea]TYR74572.1 ASCH domain-containing protein [Rossellomorea vietnamensis]TYS75134.1 ASCH domain-containing protein [Rossellomorea aquimaris]
MKVLSMTQPWASLFVLGEAKNETRTWRTNYRGDFAIHASQKIDKSACEQPVVQELLARHGLKSKTLPTGKIIGVCTLQECVKVIESHNEQAILEDGRIVSGKELWLGDYRVGNYVWKVTGMKALPEFIPAKGRLGLWEFHGEVF